ncbi:unnamed protein product, partial [Didymodactylos carnosus]
ISVDIYRLGQIYGDTTHGIWNKNELIPLLICCGGGELGVMSSDDRRKTVDWIPIDYASESIVETALNSRLLTNDHDYVHHILNPNTISWLQLLNYLHDAGLKFRIMTTNEWLKVLENNPFNSLNRFSALTFSSQTSPQQFIVYIHESTNDTIVDILKVQKICLTRALLCCDEPLSILEYDCGELGDIKIIRLLLRTLKRT